MNLGAHQDNAYLTIGNVTIIRTVLIIAMRLDVAMEATVMEAMETEVIQITMWCEGRTESFV